MWLLHLLSYSEGGIAQRTNKIQTIVCIIDVFIIIYCLFFFFYRESKKSVQTSKSTLDVRQCRMRDAFWVTSMYLWVTLQVHLLSHPGHVRHSWSQLPAAHIISNTRTIPFQSIDTTYTYKYAHWIWDQQLQRHKMNHRKQAVCNSTFKHQGVVF